MRRQIWLLLVLGVLLSLPLMARAQGTPPVVTIQTVAGYEGAYRTGEWFPVAVELTNNGPDVNGTIEWIFPNQLDDTVRVGVSLPGGARKRVNFDVLATGYTRNAQVRVLVGGAAVAEQDVSIEPIDRDRLLLLVVGDDPTLLNSLGSLTLTNGGGTDVRHIGVAALPTSVLALRSISVIMLHRAEGLSGAQIDALRLWASLGGQLVVSGGGTADAVLPADLLPLQVAAPQAGVLTSLAALAGAELPATSGQVLLTGGPALANARAIDSDGLLLAREYGTGSVSFARFDLAQLRSWQAEPVLWSAIISATPQLVPADQVHFGGRSIIDGALNLPSLALPPAWSLVLFLFTYIMVLGPVNFLVLRRIGRLEWAWLSFPAVVLVFSGLLYVAGVVGRGTAPQLYTLSVVQGSEDLPRGLATTAIGLFSPQRATYRLQLPGATRVTDTSDTGVRATAAIDTINAEEQVVIDQFQIDIGSIRTLLGERAVDTPAVSTRWDAGTGAVVRNLAGFALEDALLVRGGNYVSLGTIAPGAEVPFDQNTLTRRFPLGITSPTNGERFDRSQIIDQLFSGVALRFNTSSVYDTFGDQNWYLLAWQRATPIEIVIDNAGVEREHLTLHIIRLRNPQ